MLKIQKNKLHLHYVYGVCFPGSARRNYLQYLLTVSLTWPTWPVIDCIDGFNNVIHCTLEGARTTIWNVNRHSSSWYCKRYILLAGDLIHVNEHHICRLCSCWLVGCWLVVGHPTSISGHNIIGLIAVWHSDITEYIVAFVLAKITSCAKRVKYFVKLFGSGLDRFSGYQSSRNGESRKKN